MRLGLLSHLVRPTPPSRLVGVTVAVLMIMVETLLVYPLKKLTSESSLSMIYLFGVLLVSTVWDWWLGAATALASAVAFVHWYVQPIGRLTASDTREWVGL